MTVEMWNIMFIIEWGNTRTFNSTAWSLLTFATPSSFSLNLIHINSLAALHHFSIHNCLHHGDNLCDHWRKDKKQRIMNKSCDIC